MRFHGRVVAITGAARGLGQAYARAFAARGAKVVGVDLHDCGETVERCQEDARVCGHHAPVALGLQADVTQRDSVARALDAGVAQFGRLDGLVNNAALFADLDYGPFDKLDEDQWDAAMAVNVKGAWHCCCVAVPHMKAAGGGSIVNIASLAATYGMPNGLHYTTSKAAVIGLTRGLAREVGRHKIRVNAVAPNVVNTVATGEAFGDRKDKLVEATTVQQALRHPLEPEDVVGTVLYLASDHSRYVTGQTLMVDGGTVLL